MMGQVDAPAKLPAYPVSAEAVVSAACSHKAERIFGGDFVATPVFFRLYFYVI